MLFKEIIATEEVGIPIMYQSSIWEVLSSDLSSNTGYPECGFSWFSSIPPSKF
jgi:hypothetical protein